VAVEDSLRDRVMDVERGRPPPVSQLDGSVGRSHDVGEQERPELSCHGTLDGSSGELRDRVGDVVDRSCVDEVVLSRQQREPGAGYALGEDGGLPRADDQVARAVQDERGYRDVGQVRGRICGFMTAPTPGRGRRARTSTSRVVEPRSEATVVAFAFQALSYCGLLAAACLLCCTSSRSGPG